VAQLQNIAALRPWPDNYNEGDVGAIVYSILSFGYNDTLRIRPDLTVMAGNHSLLALYEIKASGPDILKHYQLEAKPWPPQNIVAREDGWYVDCIPLAHLSDDESTAYALADNEIARKAIPDEQKKALLLIRLAQADPKLLAGAGVDRDEIDDILKQLARRKGQDSAGLPLEAAEDTETQPDPERAGELIEKWGVAAGQVWALPSLSLPGREHRLMCGDSLVDHHLEVLLGGEIPRMVWSDPPYGLGGYSGRVYKGRKKFVAVTNDDASRTTLEAFYKVGNAADVYLCHNWEFYPLILEARGKPRSLIVWAKDYFSMGSGYRRQHEFIAYYGEFKSTNESDLWKESKDAPGNYKVPTQKPVRLPFRAMRNSTQQGDLVFAPFVGYGAEFVAGEQLARVVYGMELEPGNVALVLERVAALGLQPYCAEALEVEYDDV
jgi:hypothetical protein